MEKMVSQVWECWVRVFSGTSKYRFSADSWIFRSRVQEEAEGSRRQLDSDPDSVGSEHRKWKKSLVREETTKDGILKSPSIYRCLEELLFTKQTEENCQKFRDELSLWTEMKRCKEVRSRAQLSTGVAITIAQQEILRL